MILVGGGIHLSQGYDALRALAEVQSIPVAHTMSGKGGIACTHQLSAGLFGRYSRIANELIEASDCLLVVGCKLGEIATKRYALPSRSIPLIHLEIVAEEIGRCMPAAVAFGAMPAPGSRTSAKPSPMMRGRAAPRAPTMSPKSGSEWRRGATRPQPGSI